MDRIQGLILLLLVACGAPAPRGAGVQVVSRGTLAYAVELCGDRLVAVELGERFELVVRDADGAREAARLDLGPPEHDWPALACAGDRAWVGGETGEVVHVELPTAARTGAWRTGAAVTALAAADGLVAIGDGAGVLCLRRAGDGALLQCAVAHAAAIAEVEPAGAALVTRDVTGDSRRWALPSLADSPPGGAAALTWGGDPVRVVGRRVERRRGDRWELVVEMAGTVQDVAIAGPRLAIAAWIGRLDQASVVLVGGGTMDR